MLERRESEPQLKVANGTRMISGLVYQSGAPVKRGIPLFGRGGNIPILLRLCLHTGDSAK